jgi:hypothetical protein
VSQGLGGEMAKQHTAPCPRELQLRNRRCTLASHPSERQGGREVVDRVNGVGGNVIECYFQVDVQSFNAIFM